MGPRRYECIPSTLSHMSELTRRCILAVTGTPGTGKTTLAAFVRERIQGSECHSVADLAELCGAIADQQDGTGPRDVDIERMATSWSELNSHFTSEFVLIDGHLSHLLPVDAAILLRCRPDVLRERLETRGWPGAKVEENAEAEFIGSIAADIVSDAVPCFEVTSHDGDVMKIADDVVIWLEKGFPSVGPTLDWLEGGCR